MMRDTARLLAALAESTAALATVEDVDVVLRELAERAVDLLEVTGAGVGLLDDGRLVRACAVSAAADRLLRLEEAHQRGPCLDAARDGRDVQVDEVAARSASWPEYHQVADESGVRAVAAVPLRSAGGSFGALVLVETRARAWSALDIALGRVLADVAATRHALGRRLLQQERLNAQLQEAFRARLVIEQAKGMTARAHGIPVEDAFERLRKHARDRNASIRSVAEAVVHLGLEV
jgi:GAF domain-containing protein